MAITTKVNIKLFMGLATADTSMDALINMLLPKVELDYKRIRNKDFDHRIVGEELGYGDGTKKEFTVKHPPIIVDPTLFYNEVVYNTGVALSSSDYKINYNTGKITFTVAPVDNARLTVDYSSQEIQYPDGAEITAIEMVDYLCSRGGSSGLKSESLGDHSESKENVVDGYPESITGSIKRFVRLT